jgi:predicted transcriptional regulator
MSVTTTLRAVPDSAKPRTDTEEKLWRALLDSPGSTATALSTAAGIGKSTAPKILARWEGVGLVARTPGIADGGRRTADRWAIVTDDQTADDLTAGSLPTDDRSADDRPTGGQPCDDQVDEVVDVPVKSERLAPGALRGLVEDYLRDHPGQQVSPNTIGKALNRSAGAVHNALEKLVEGGDVVRTSAKPKKYCLAADTAATR